MLIARTIAYLPAQVLGPLAQFASTVAWTHVLTPAELGAFAIVWAVQEFVYLAVMSWWSYYALRYAAGFETPAERARLDGAEIHVGIMTGLLQSLATVIAVSAVLTTEITAELAIAAVVFTVTRSISTHIAERARARNEILVYTILQITGPVFGLALGLAVTLTGLAPATATTAIAAYGVTQAIGLALGLAIHRLATWRPRRDDDIIRAAWRFGVPLVVAEVFGWFGTHGIRLIVDVQMGPAAVGLMTVGWWLGLRATTFASVLVGAAFFPLTVERLREGGRDAAMPQLATGGALLLVALLPATLGLAIIAEPAVRLAVAEPFQEATIAILPLALAAGFVRAIRIFFIEQTFLLFERTRMDMLTNAAEGLLVLVFGAAGLAIGGVTGAVIGCLLAMLIATCLAGFAARRIFGLYVRAGDLARITAANGVMAGVLLLLPVEATVASIGLAIAISAATYALALAALYPAGSRAAIRRVLRPRQA